MMPWAHHDAAQPSSCASGGAGTDAAAAANPSTVAGPTRGPARALVTTPTTLTCPDTAATTGSVARCAASGTATDSAAARGSQPASRSAQRPAHQTMPALASTERVKPSDRPRNGSRRTSTSTATPRCRRPRRRPPVPRAASATSPMAAARSTLGSVRHNATNTATPASPTPRSHQPRTPSQRAASSKNASSSVRFAPETAVRWVSPVVRKSASRAGLIAEVSPSTRAGTRARGSGGRVRTACRSPARTVSTARSVGPGGATTTARSRTRATAATSDPASGACSRAVKRTRLPTGRPRHTCIPADPVATTSSGARTAHVVPRPASSTDRTRAVR